MANTVQVSSSIWNWVSIAVQLSGTSRANLELWRSGEKQPTFNQLEEFSSKTRIPLGYFFLDSPPVENLKILEFRTVDSLSLQNPSRDLIDTVRQMENVQEWMREYVIAEQGGRISFIGTLNIENDVRSLAVTVRKVLSLPISWYEQSKTPDDSFKFIRQAISDVGVIVMMNGIVGSNTHRALSIDEFRAFTLIDEYAPLIFINSSDLRSSMLFSLLHEFIHIGIGTSSLFNAGVNDSSFVNPHEVVCNAVTAEILVPHLAFCDKWLSINEDLSLKVSALATHFKCSQSVIARRALDCRFITNDEYSRLISLAKQIVKAKPVSSGGDYYKTQATRIDQKFLLALNASLHEGKTLHTEAFRLTNTNRSTFDGLISEVRGERK